MPATSYMILHARHDHSLRIPRPDRTQDLNAPNACDQCHADRSAAWAAEAIKSWSSSPRSGFQSFAEAFDLSDRNAPGARLALMRVIADESQSPIARASALARFSRPPTRDAVERAAEALANADPLVRMASIMVVANADAKTRATLLAPLLSDPARVVRMEAARALAGEAEAELGLKTRESFEKALDEYIAAQRFNAERAESQANLGALYAARGQIAAARAAYEKALALDRSFFPAVIAFAELTRAGGDEAGAEALLRDALAANSGEGALFHALGLSLIRQKRIAEAIPQLAEATKRAPAELRFAYVYAVALHDTGKPLEALDVLKGALVQAPYDRDVLLALAAYELEAGASAAALSHAELLARLEPDDAEIQQFWRSLKTSAR